MGRLLDGIFAFSLLDLSADAMWNGCCSLREQLQFAVESVQPLARKRDITITVDALSDAGIALDADACAQMLVNLLENAVKYGSTGGRIAVGTSASDRDVMLTVDDDGPGIAPGERDSIFNLRVRGSSAGSRPGTGIGLAIVKVIVERAGGEIHVKDAPLGGARFEVTLPRRAESEALPA